MVAFYNIEFKGKPPEIEYILQQVRRSTGLEIDIKDHGHGFLSKKLQESIDLIVEGKTITIALGYRKIIYLLGATLNTLAEMGGTHDYDDIIPLWTRQKYEDVSFYKRFTYTNIRKITRVLSPIFEFIITVLMILFSPFILIYKVMRPQRIK